MAVSVARIGKHFMGKLLRDHRVRAGMSQMDVAAACGYTTPQFVSNWERGIADPPLNMLPILAGLFGINVDAMTEEVIRLQANEIREGVRQCRLSKKEIRALQAFRASKPRNRHLLEAFQRQG